MTGRRYNHLRTLQAHFLLALALIGVLPLGLVGLGIAMLDRQALAEQAAQELTGLARSLAGQLEVYMQDMLSATRAMAALPEIVSLDPARQEPLLKELFHHYPQISRLSTFDLLGARLASSHPGMTPSIPVRQSFQTAAQRGHQMWEVVILRRSGRAVLLIHTPIRDAERRVVGVVGAVIDLANLSAVIGGVPIGGRVFVLDADGRVLLHPERAVVQERRDYSWIGIPTGGRPASPATVRYQAGGETLVAGYAPIPNVNWTVVVARPEQVILAPARRSWHLALVGLGTSTGLALLMALVLARMLTRPVHALATAAQALAAGDATVSLAATAAPASELQTLIEAFTAMRQAVMLREGALHQSEAEAERRQQEAEILADLARTLNTSLDMDTVLLRVADGAKTLCQADTASLALRDPHAGAIILRYWDGRRALASEELVIEVGKGVGGQVLLSGLPFRTANYAADPRLTHDYQAIMRQRQSMAVMAVPIAIGDQVEGLLYVANRTARPFTDRDETILLQLADHAAVAIENARLFQETQRAYQELAQTQQHLIQAQKMEAVGRLAGGVAHDFNNLLTVIIGRVQLLLARLLPAEPARREVEQIQVAADRAATLTRQLLAFSRKQVLQPSVLNLNTLVADMHTMLQRLLSEAIVVTTVLDPALGRVKADRGQLDQVLLNLVINARDAMPQGGHLALETANVYLDDAAVRDRPDIRSGPYVRLEICDTGVGMDAATQAHLFEPFFTTKGPEQGTGLGLATVHGIVTQSGGHLTVDSVLGQGTTFSIYLPRVEEAVDTSAPEAAQEGPQQGVETIVLVEDHAAIRDITQTILQQHGYTVLAAADGREALQHSAQHEGPIHLLLTDVVMPGMSGRELADRLVRLRPEVRVLYMSGYPDDALSHHGVLEPGTALLLKPFAPHGLLQKVREVLRAGPTRRVSVSGETPSHGSGGTWRGSVTSNGRTEE